MKEYENKRHYEFIEENSPLEVEVQSLICRVSRLTQTQARVQAEIRLKEALMWLRDETDYHKKEIK